MNEILTVDNCVHEIEEYLGLEPDFLRNLQNEDDWSLIVKAHAMIESTLSHALTKVTGVEALSDFFSRLELSDIHVGKIVYAEALGLLGKAERRFIRKLSELRNKLVHDIRKTKFSISAYIAELDNNQFAAFAKDIASFGPSEPFEYNGRKITIIDVVREDPKAVLWQATMSCIAVIYTLWDKKQIEEESKRLATLVSWLKENFAQVLKSEA